MTQPPPVRLAAILTLGVLAGCGSTPGPPSGPPSPTATTAVIPSAAAPDAIRAVDPASLPWQWFESHARSEPVDVSSPDKDGRSYAVGEPVYSDADGDGLEDLAVPLSQTDGNGFRERWHIWLAGPDGAPRQVLIPIAATARCGDAVTSVTAIDGGFQVKEILREPVIDDQLPCSDPGTFEVTRGVGVLREGEATYPVDLRDRRGYGGVCPTQQRTETGITTVWGSVGPDPSASLSIDGERMYLIATHPHSLTSGAEPKVLAAVWPPQGHVSDRICVWIDPARFQGSGE